MFIKEVENMRDWINKNKKVLTFISLVLILISMFFIGFARIKPDIEIIKIIRDITITVTFTLSFALNLTLNISLDYSTNQIKEMHVHGNFTNGQSIDDSEIVKSMDLINDILSTIQQIISNLTFKRDGFSFVPVDKQRDMVHNQMPLVNKIESQNDVLSNKKNTIRNPKISERIIISTKLVNGFLTEYKKLNDTVMSPAFMMMGSINVSDYNENFKAELLKIENELNEISKLYNPPQTH